MKKSFLVVALLLVAGMVFGTAAPPADDEDVTIVVGEKTLAQNDKERVWPYAVVEGIYDATGINLDIKPLTDETINLALASGDLPDIMNIDKQYFGQMIDAEQVIALDDLIEERGASNLTDAWPLRTEFSRRFMSNDTGNLYWLPTLAGTAGWERRYGGPGFFASWDFYKQLGSPELENTDESILDFVEELLELYPETEDGKPTYGFAHFNDWGLWSWKIMHGTKDGYMPVVVDGYQADAQTSELYSEWLDVDNSPYWASMVFYNKANRRGILDPDSLTMNLDAFQAKCAALQYPSGYADWFVRAPGGDEDEMFAIPIDGVTITIGQTSLVGAASGLGVTNTAERPDKAVDLMNWLFSTDATRLFGGGIEGVHWNYDEDGVPRMEPYWLEQAAAGSEEYLQQGIWNYALLGLAGSHLNTTHTDGYIAGIINGPEVWVARNSPALTDFAETYGFATQGEVWRDLYEQGRVNAYFDFKSDIIQALPQAPDDIRRIDTRLLDIASRAIPDLVLAEDDAAFEAAREQVLADFRAAGAEEAWDWWKTEWDEARAFVDSVLGD